MDDALRAASADRRSARLICRNGDPTIASELHRVNIRQAHTVVVIGSDAPTSDATVAAMVLAVEVACDGFRGRTVVAEIDDPAAAQALNEACDGEVEVVGDEVVADVLAMWMARPATAGLVRELLAAQGSRLAFCDLPEPGERPFGDVVNAAPHARPIGIRRADGAVVLAPDADTVVAPGESIVCVTDGSEVRWDGFTPTASRPVPAPVFASPAPQHLIVVGWSRLAPGLLLKLRQLVPSGSTVHVLCDADLVTADEIAMPALEPLTVKVTRVGDPEHEIVAVLGDRPCSAIVVLAHQGVAANDADAITLATLMAVRRASVAIARPAPFVVAELTDSKHADLALVAGARETVAKSALLGDAIAFAAVSPEARPILDALQRPDGPSVRLIPALALELVGEYSFAAVAAAAYQHGLLAVGTRSPEAASGLRLRVSRSETLRLGEHDEVAVIVEPQGTPRRLLRPQGVT